jgi:hypothetical protein
MALCLGTGGKELKMKEESKTRRKKERLGNEKIMPRFQNPTGIEQKRH